MKSKKTENRLLEKNIREFKNNGWTLIDLKLSKSTIKNAIKGLKEMREKSLINNYQPRRIYYDHLITNNLAAIEMPFNHMIINNRIENLFREAEIGSLVKNLMGWENPCCDLARLFCMGNYKYRGRWHRDYSDDLNKIQKDSSTRNIVQAGIYILPQKGFRLLRKDYDFNGENSIVRDQNIDAYIRNFNCELNPPKESFFEINGSMGTLLLFDPFLLHQGSNFKSRFDFHMRFINDSSNAIQFNNFQDFAVKEHLHKNFKFLENGKNINQIYIKNIPFTKKQKKFKRFLTSLDYLTGLKRIFKLRKMYNNKFYKIIKKEGWKIDYFSNTIFQK